MAMTFNTRYTSQRLEILERKISMIRLKTSGSRYPASVKKEPANLNRTASGIMNRRAFTFETPGIRHQKLNSQ
jgi:hypothetical protein